MSTYSVSITKIVQQLSTGDKSVVSTLWFQIWDGVKSRATLALGHHRLSDVYADDVAQEAILDVLDRVVRRKTDGNLKSRHVWKMLKGATTKQAQKIKTTEQRDQQVRADHHQHRPDVTFNALVNREFLEELDGLGTLLDEESRTIVTMLVHGYSTTEVSSELNLAPRTVQRRIQKIKNFITRQKKGE